MVEVLHVLREAIATGEPNGSQAGVLGRKSFLGSHVNT